MSNSAPTGWLVILGDALIGETLTARPNAVEDADGINKNTASFQWLRDGEPISGATGQTYQVTANDTGSEISVQYMYRDNRGNSETVTSRPEPAVPTSTYVNTTPYIAPNRDIDLYEAPNNTEPTGWLVILGDPEVGNTLTARPNAVEDEDGIKSSTISYQWFREDELITGATEQTYEVTSADQGKRISVEYAYTDGNGTREVVYSKPKDTVPYVDGSTPTTPVVEETPEEIETPDVPDTPVIPDTPVGHINSGPVGIVYILGVPVEDTQLLARTDSLYDRDHILEGTRTFQWLRDGEPINGATGKTYMVTAEDRGTELSVQHSYVDGVGTVETVTSTPLSPVIYPEGEEPEVEQSAGFEAASPDSSGSDAVTTPEDDVVVITSDMSRVDGLEGTDTAVLAGDQEDYTVTFSPDGVTVTDRSDGGVGPVELTNFEFLDFDTELAVFGGPMDLAQFGSHTGLNAAEFEAFVEMYIAYFNRAPDAVGLAFWGSAFANGNTMEEIAEMFADQPETLATYPADSSNIKFVSDVYQNVLGRAPDIDGLRFWTGQLDDGNTGRGEFILAMLNGVEDGSADRAYLDQKTDIGAYFSVQKGMSNTDDATQVMALFDGTDNSVQTAVDAIDALYDASMSSQNGDFLMPLVGVLDDPFAV